MTDVMAFLKGAIAATDDTSATMIAPGGGELKLVARPLTPQDVKMIAKDHPNFIMAPTPEAMVSLIILKARLTNGEKAFTLEHKRPLMDQQMSMITKAFGDLFGEQMEELQLDEDSLDARKGKSKATS